MPTIRFYDRDVEVGNEELRRCLFCDRVLRGYQTADGQHWILLTDFDGLSHVATCPEYAWALRKLLEQNATPREAVMAEDIAVALTAPMPPQLVEEIWHEVQEAKAIYRPKPPRCDGPRWTKRPPIESNQMVQTWPPVYHTDVPLRMLFGQERPGDRELLREIAP